MLKKRGSYVLLTTLILGSLSVSVPVFAEVTSQGEIKEKTMESTKFEGSSQLESLEADGTQSTEKNVGETIMGTDTSDRATKESQEVSAEEEEDGFYYPSNRSDIEPSYQAYAASRSNLSITDNNKPKADFVDISSHNGDISVAEFKKISSYGVKGVSVKLTEATSYRNPYAYNQVKNAQAAGLSVSVYHYSWFQNNTQAKAEAQYFANMANDLGLPKSTLMVNDLEETKIKANNSHTSNAKAFENELNRLGFNRVNHYLGLHWINEGRISPNELGNEKVWVAAYPYTPTAYQQHTQYGAWQWSSSMTFPGVHGVFDISSDYQGSYSENTASKPLPPQGNYISDGRYVVVNKKGYSTWSDFDWKFRGKTDDIYNQKFQARVRYQHTNGSTYFSLYDVNGKWYGYLNADATSVLNGPEGNYISDGRYVSSRFFDKYLWSSLLNY